MKAYPLADCPTMAERPGALTRRQMRAVKTGEFRPPLKGEWYLSGAIPEAYKAPHDLSVPYHIVQLVSAAPDLAAAVRDLISRYELRLKAADQLHRLHLNAQKVDGMLYELRFVVRDLKELLQAEVQPGCPICNGEEEP